MGSVIAEGFEKAAKQARPIQNPVQPTQYGTAFRYGQTQPYKPSSPAIPQQPQARQAMNNGEKFAVSPPPPQQSIQQKQSPSPFLAKPQMYRSTTNQPAASAKQFKF